MSRRTSKSNQSVLKVINKKQLLRLGPCVNLRSLLCGTTLLIVGAAVLFTKALIIEYITVSFFVLTPHSLLKDLWVQSGDAMPTQIYLMNWTNPEDFYNKSIKLKLQEVGPYIFKQNIKKVNLTWNQNDTVTYKQLRLFHYNDQVPNNNLSDPVTSINFVTAVFSSMVKDENYIIRRIASTLINNASPNIYLSKTAKEFIYGVQDGLINLGNAFSFLWEDSSKYHNIGVLAILNNSVDSTGTINMGTGLNQDFNIHQWNYRNDSVYYTKPCSKVFGSLGELHQRNLGKDYIIIFVPDTCRHLKLDFEREVKVKGISGFKFSLGESVLDNGTILLENKCFCHGECLPSGMLSMSGCRHGFPPYMSLPHFYKADPIYREQFEGLKPNKVEHEAFVVLEPVTGITLEVSASMQVNVKVQPVSGIDVYEDARTLFFPYCWLKQYAIIPDSWALAIKIYLYFPLIFTVLSTTLIVIGLYAVFVNKRLTAQFKKRLNWCKEMSEDIVERSEPEKTILLLQKELNCCTASIYDL